VTADRTVVIDSGEGRHRTQAAAPRQGSIADADTVPVV
jgi:hypothetical protein